MDDPRTAHALDEAIPASASPYQPTLRDLIMLEQPQSVKVSANGNRLAVRVRTTNWRDNVYESVCFVHTVADGRSYPLNRSGSALQAEWLDDESVALLIRPSGEKAKAQIWLYEGLTGEGWAVTDHKTGVDSFTPFAGGILFTAKQPERDENKARSDRFGKFTRYEHETSATALYYVGLTEMRAYIKQQKSMTEDEAKKLVKPVVEVSRLMQEQYAIKSVVALPQGGAIYVNCWRRDDMVYRRDTRTYRLLFDGQKALARYVELEGIKKARQGEETSATPQEDSSQTEDVAYLGEVSLLPLPKASHVEAISPDGQKLLIAYQGGSDKGYARTDLWLLEVEALLRAEDAESVVSAMENLTAVFDREMMELYWVEAGLFGTYIEGTTMRLAAIHETGFVDPLSFSGVLPQTNVEVSVMSFHVSQAGRVGLVGASSESFSEAYLAESLGEGKPWSLVRLTNFGAAIDGWQLGTVETIRWTSKDGAQIEGVIRKPNNFDPSKRYPLLFVVHGGPTWYSSSLLLNYEDMTYYPSAQFVNQEMIVVKPNYRGSLGYGQSFVELNVNNLGVGDLWDIESAVDHLVELGWADPERVGCMGWSQGGYISAFAGLHSDKFKAVSVGAGISDWYTYHISNDIPDFTIDYLSGSPFRNRELYVKTAPISNIGNAHTPMLIQHGTEDRRVPISNAYELYRGLKEMDVPVELFIYPGMAHPITKPRENHAVMYQNLHWFSHYLLGTELQLE